jgi:predicted nucleic acid-binding protein
VDTSALFALLDRDDRNHASAGALFSGLMEDRTTLVTSNYVLVESFALLQRRIGIEAAAALQHRLVPVLHVTFVSPDVHRLGMAAFLGASKRSLSLVDCVSFELMRSLGIACAFAFDRHFQENGFQAPAPRGHHP